MLVKTEGIVLHTIKHTDSGIVTHILTRDYGRLTFMARGVHSKKGNTRSVFFQPLQILKLEAYFKDGRDLNSLKEVTVSEPLTSIPVNITKTSMAIFISEVLYRTSTETETNRPLYDFIRDGICYLDRYSGNPSNFHIGFLVGLSKYLGIAPGTGDNPNHDFFDMQSGHFCNARPLHGYYLHGRQSVLLRRFLESTLHECETISLSGKERAAFLDSLIAFFSIHLPGARNIKSLDVLSQLFNPKSPES
ncbi:MAG: DNA repair protein RecO [Bacteroidales bacterium]